MCKSEEQKETVCCPVCGSTLEQGEGGWRCGHEGCGFSAPLMKYGVGIGCGILRQLATDGHTKSTDMTNRDGQPFKGAFVLRDGKVEVLSWVHYISGQCPVCSGNIRRTSKGYRCENALGSHPTCSFMIPGIICNRPISEQEASDFLHGHRVVLEGFANNEWKMFSSTLVLDENRQVKLESRIATCPHCGGDLHVGMKAFNCANYKREGQSCKFVIWNHIGGHRVTADEAREICELGATQEAIEFYKEDGTVYYKRLALSPEKDRIIMI